MATNNAYLNIEEIYNFRISITIIYRYMQTGFASMPNKFQLFYNNINFINNCIYKLDFNLRIKNYATKFNSTVIDIIVPKFYKRHTEKSRWRPSRHFKQL